MQNQLLEENVYYTAAKEAVAIKENCLRSWPCCACFFTKSTNGIKDDFNEFIRVLGNCYREGRYGGLNDGPGGDTLIQTFRQQLLLRKPEISHEEFKNLVTIMTNKLSESKVGNQSEQLATMTAVRSQLTPLKVASKNSLN